MFKINKEDIQYAGTLMFMLMTILAIISILLGIMGVLDHHTSEALTFTFGIEVLATYVITRALQHLADIINDCFKARG